MTPPASKHKCRKDRFGYCFNSECKNCEYILVPKKNIIKKSPSQMAEEINMIFIKCFKTKDNVREAIENYLKRELK